MSSQPIATSLRSTLADQVDLTAALRFVAVGTAGTALYVGLFAVAQLVLSTTLATVAAFSVSTVLTNLAHRRVTYGVRRASGAAVDSLVAFGTTLIGLALSTVLTNAVDGLGVAYQVPMLIAGTAAGGAIRFVLMKLWLTRAGASA
ncbi:hypothetical protein HJ590_06755 [Naumannella sp. ID2617S]|nr:hypothetical protein [Naumannella sp. ID2617S]